ncbi:MAG: O-antigen ligase family protein [Candidatus Polarisedimenticolia bacterium]
MPAAAIPAPARHALLLAGLCAALAALSWWVGNAPVHLPLLLVGAAILFLSTLLYAEAGLVIIVVSMLLSPEIPLGGAGGPGLEGSRSVILRTEDLVLLLVGLAWMARMAIHKDLGAIRRTPLNAAIFAYTACCLFSTFLGIEAGRVRPLIGMCYIAKYVEYFLLFFITVNHVRSREQWRRLLAAVLATGALITAYAGWQIPSGARPSAPFEGRVGEPNTLGGYLVLMFAVAAGVALLQPRGRLRIVLALLAVATLPPLLATLSRSSWIAFVVALLTLLLLAPVRRPLVVGAIVGAALLVFANPQNVEDRVRYTFGGAETRDRAGRIRLDSSTSARLESWGEATRAFVRRPLFGWGITGYGFLDAQYFRILVELGASGFAAFALLMAFVWRTSLRAFRELEDPLHRGLALGMCAALTGLLAHAIGANTFMLIRVMEPFWLLCALVVASLSFGEAAA